MSGGISPFPFLMALLIQYGISKLSHVVSSNESVSDMADAVISSVFDALIR